MELGPRSAVTHRIGDDLGETGDGYAWATDADGADAEILAGLNERLEVERKMDEMDEIAGRAA